MSEARFRLDKWLWHARVVKTRGLAQDLIAKGRVRINRQKTDAPGKGVKLGDVLTLTLPHGVMVVEILAFGARRGPAPEARALYRDLSPQTHSSSAAGSDLEGENLDDDGEERPQDRRAGTSTG